MDISVIESIGVPDNAYLSIRVGDTRRQAAVSRGEPFSFPSASHRSFTIDVFEKVGSQQVSLAPLQSVISGMYPNCGSCVTDHVEKVDIKKLDGSAMTLALKVGITPPEKQVSGRTRRHKAAIKAKSYLDDHGVQTLLETMVHQLIGEQPEDPIHFMCSYLMEHRPGAPRTAPAATAAPAPAVPVASADPLSITSSAQMPDLSEHHSMMATVLKSDPGIYNRLKELKTAAGTSLSQCISCGLENRGHCMVKMVGVVAGDAECYWTFQELFDPVLKLCHGPEVLPLPGRRHPKERDILKVTNTVLNVPDSASVHITLRRSLCGRRFAAVMTQEERRQVERSLVDALLSLQGDFKGEYFPLASSNSWIRKPSGMSPEDESRLRSKNVLFQKPDAPLASMYCQDWPDARGIFVAQSESFYAWVNEEDHLLMSTRLSGGDVKTAFSTLCNAETAIRCALLAAGEDFECDPRLGYISSCPTNVGTGLLANVALKLPHISAHPEFHSLCEARNLQFCQSDEDSMWELSNNQCLGLSEVDIINGVIEGCAQLLELDCSAASCDEEISSIQKTASPGLGIEYYPGFPVTSGPEKMPGLSRHHSVMAAVLKGDPSMYERLKDVKTRNGVTFAACIKPGMDEKGNPGLPSPGLVAGDIDCYDVFCELFVPVLENLHSEYTVIAKHHTDLSPHKLTATCIDPAKKYLVETRLHAKRNLKGFRLAPQMTRTERLEVERLIADASRQLPAYVAGVYRSFSGSNSQEANKPQLSNEEMDRLRSKGLIFGAPQALSMLSAGIGRHWPHGRGVLVNSTEDFALWANAEDHVCMIAADDGGDVKATFTRLCEVAKALETALKKEGHSFLWDDNLGYVSYCPATLGTALKVSVTLKVELFGSRPDFEDICRSWGLVGRRLEFGIWEVSNSECLFISEVDLMNQVIEGCKKIVDMEMALEMGKPMYSILPGLGSEEFPGFQADKCPKVAPDLSNHHSVMADILKANPAIYDKLKDIKTSSGTTFAKCIKTGIDNLGHPMIKTVGVVAADEECYEVFNDLFDPVIEIRHDGYLPSQTHPTDLDYTKVTDLEIDPSGQHAIATRMRSGRNLRGLRLLPSIDINQRREVERLLVKAMHDLTGDLQGDYYPLPFSTSYLPKPGGMSVDDEEHLREESFMFQEPDSMLLLSSGVGRHWPDARGVFNTDQKKLVAWINEEDHIRLMSMDMGGDLKSVFTRFCEAEAAIRRNIQAEGYEFMRNDHLGYVTMCPSNLGTGLRMSMMLSIPQLSSRPDFRELCMSLKLQAKGGIMADAAFAGGVWDISNAARLGTSEVDQVNGMIHGCRKLVQMEQALERGEAIDELLAVQTSC